MTKDKKIRNKIKVECVFLYFLAHNPHEEQSKKILCYLITSFQYLVLRELVVNDMAQNLPKYGKNKLSLCKRLKSCLQRLVSGKFKKHNLHHLYHYLKILASDKLKQYDLCH